MIIPFSDGLESTDSFEGHIDDLYDADISYAHDSFVDHMQDFSQSTDLRSMEFHLDQAEAAKSRMEFFEDCKSQAIHDHEYEQAKLDGINKQWELADRYETEMRQILSPHASDISFGNSFDDATARFINECHADGFQLPSSVDHSSFYDSTIVDRHSNGGMLTIDKSIVRGSLETAVKEGKITQDQFDKLSELLTSC